MAVHSSVARLLRRLLHDQRTAQIFNAIMGLALAASVILILTQPVSLARAQGLPQFPNTSEKSFLRLNPHTEVRRGQSP